jgi:hypothetical protein
MPHEPGCGLAEQTAVRGLPGAAARSGCSRRQVAAQVPLARSRLGGGSRKALRATTPDRTRRYVAALRPEQPDLSGSLWVPGSTFTPTCSLVQSRYRPPTNGLVGCSIRARDRPVRHDQMCSRSISGAFASSRSADGHRAVVRVIVVRISSSDRLGGALCVWPRWWWRRLRVSCSFWRRRFRGWGPLGWSRASPWDWPPPRRRAPLSPSSSPAAICTGPAWSPHR